MQRAKIGFWESQIYRLAQEFNDLEKAENLELTKALRFLLYLDSQLT